MTAVALVVAKAPVPGEVKTRLAASVGEVAAADLAAAALLDTIDACEQAFDRCHLAISGRLDLARSGRLIERRLRTWQVHDQRGHGLGERLANAHRDVGVAAAAPVVQLGMDTPHVDPAVLASIGAGVAGADAVLGAADDGGWWVLALRQPSSARALASVPMSTPTTYDETLAALRAAGVEVLLAPRLADVDTAADAELVAAQAPSTRFAAIWEAVQ